ncbi:uncharacterized protein TRIVIDRAFT_223885 [Trichoderma virens Gv29-8]|uniref:Apple domain-containing protein n=1 Tax=Hypocrea virens (strain Gv29-8 / FGSC 10586) TaxID=413071 RepID=G9MYE6_HYPVG|nr:uncharacterized protein TRIVIDRAFT_223885 [Trichoderma virens Gv29-8]EHK20568.1 hypothetical protein TRIVIDRAFT_223885 [Trichoderma virens Gv29-8]UKZ53026.1 hypothetical protein TrVGV298_006813 [Trichoderma virens]
MRLLLAGASALLLLATEAASHAIPVAESNEIAVRSQTFRANNGVQFSVETGFDHHGGDYKSVTASSLHDCINSSVNAAVINSKVTGAVRVQYVPTPITCPVDGSSRVKMADGRYFTIQCGVNHLHGDIESIQTLDFANCILLCDEAKGCVAASWRSGTCYLKKSLQSGVAGTGASTTVLTALLPADPVFCPGPSGQQVKETSGRTFTVSSNTDHPGSDLRNKLLANFGDCIAWCDETTGWLPLSIMTADLKSKLTASTTRTNSQFAVLNSVLSPPPSLCPGQNGKQIKEPSGRSFTVACNVDRAGADMASKKLNNFNSCITWCDQTSGCIAAAYHDGECWLKKTLSPSSPRANGQIAVLSSKLPQTSTHTTSTSTRKTTSTSTTKTTSTSTTKTTSSTTTASTTSTSPQSSQVSTSATTSSNVSTSFSSDTTISLPSDTSTSSSGTTSAATSAPSETTTPSTPTTDSNWGSSTSTTDAPTTASDTTSSSSVQTTTGSPAPSGTAQIPPGPLTLPAQPTVTLRPLAPPNVDVASTEYPSVILDNSINILDIHCDLDKSLSANFNGATAYNAAKESWAEAEGSSNTLIIIAAASGCSSDGHYVYFVASHISFDDASKSVSCSGSIESASDIAQDAGVDFGSIEISVPTLEPNPELAAAYGCTAPGSNEIDGLPAIYCGPDFHYCLNNKLGYYSIADEDLDATLATVLPGTQVSDLQHRGLLSKIGSFVSHAATTLVNTVKDGAKAIGNDIVSAATTLGKDAVSNLKNLGNTILGAAESFAKGLIAAATFIITGDYDRSFDFPVQIAPPNSTLDDSPWGDGFKFYTWTPDKGEYWNAQNEAIDKIKGVIIGEADPEPSVELWCVDCHANGKLKLVGSASFSILKGLTKAQLSMDGNLDVGLYLGMNAFAQWNPKEEYDFLSVGLPGLSIPDILTIGPVLSLGVSVDLDVSAVGQYLVGADMEWTQLSAKLDVLNPRSSSKSGWTPNIRDTVQADGSLTINSTLGLPVSLGFGLNILNGKYEKEIKLVDTPGVRASMEYDFTNEVNNGEVNTDPEDSCCGIHWSVGIVNTVTLDLSDIGQGKYRLDEYNAPVFASGCIGKSLTIAPPSTTVSAPTGGTTSVPPSGPNCASLTCANDDGKFCTASGTTFQLNCYSIYASTLERAFKFNSADACANSCATDSSCVGVNFIFNQLNFILPDCLQYSNGLPSSPAPVSLIGSFRKVSSPHKRVELVQCATTVATSASASGTANAKILVKDTLTLTPTASASSTATSTEVTSMASTTTSLTATSTDATAISTTTSSPDSDHVTAPITIRDATGQLLINPHVNGSSVSMNSLTDGTTFTADLTSSLVYGDSAGRILYYFPSTISAVGASRLRLGTWDAIPIGAEMIMLFPTVTDTGVTVLVAMDSTQHIFYPFLCDIEGQLNKIFLVSDATTGASKLMDSDLTYTVIGGVARSCVSLAMVAKDLPGWNSTKATPTQ